VIDKANDVRNTKIVTAIDVLISIVSLGHIISLQFCCNFINTNKHYILFISNIASIVSMPLIILSILYYISILQNLINTEKSKESNHKHKKLRIISISVLLIYNVTKVLIKTKVVDLLDNARVISYVKLLPTILFVGVFESILCYRAYKEWKTNKDSSKDNDLTQSLILKSLIFLLGLTGFMIKIHMFNVSDIPIHLGNEIVFILSVSATISVSRILYYMVPDVKKLFSSSANTSTMIQDLGVASNINKIKIMLLMITEILAAKLYNKSMSLK
uniref:hypothetical protein n=1 Tax=Wolbachia endosymbiont of Pentidionis agamae TaxID=3110435 RepID=UPI002FD7928D